MRSTRTWILTWIVGGLLLLELADQAGSNGVPAAVKKNNTKRIENAHRRLVSLIATTEEFSLR